MRRFMTKSLILIVILFGCVISGMVLAKQSMVDMAADPGKVDAWYDFNIEFYEHSKKEMTELVENNTSLKERMDKLEHVENFNPYGTMGESVSSGVSSVIESGLKVTSELFSRVVGIVL